MQRRPFLLLISGLCAGSFLFASPAAGAGSQAEIQRALYSVGAVAGGFEAGNPAQRLTARFTPAGARVDSEDLNITLRLAGYGYGERLLRPVEARPEASGNRLEYRRGGLTEWYVNTPEGVEQGFTLAARPGRAAPGERLTIVLEVGGATGPALTPGGDSIALGNLRYTGLKAWDAAGRELASEMDVRGGRVRLRVDDTDAAYPVTVDPLVRQAWLQYGTSGVAVDGDTAVVGNFYSASNRGELDVFVRSNGTWTQQAGLTASDGIAEDQLGRSVAVSGNTIVAGASHASGNSGAVYVFVRSGATWTQQQKLTPSGSVQYFGTEVAVNGDTAVVGSNSGKSYVFTRSGSSWTEQTTIPDSGALAMSADILMIGGHVYTGGGAAWTQQTQLPNCDGYTTSVSGDTVVLGDFRAANARGKACVFVRNGGVWTQQATLTAPDGVDGDQFGQSVAVSGDVAAVGTYYRQILGYNVGSVYVFTRTGDSWQLAGDQVGAPPNGPYRMGMYSAMSGDTLITGGNNGATLYLLPLLTVQSTPPGLTFTASGAGCASGGTMTTPKLLLGGGCAIQFASPAQNPTGDAQYTFQNWHDGYIDNPRAFPAVPQHVPYTAAFSTQYLLSAAASPPSGGQVSGSGWYGAGVNAGVAATPNPGYLFSGFGGGLTGMGTPQVLSMDGPKTVTGSFIPLPGAALSALISSKSGAQNSRTWTITVNNSGPGVAYSPQINGVVLTQTYGTACAPLRLSPAAFPAGLANLGIGSATAPVQFNFNACPANARFTVVVVFTANGGSSGGATALANQTM